LISIHTTARVQVFDRLLHIARNNPDYAAAVLTGYGLIALQIVVQIFLVPLYLDRLGQYMFGALMILFAYVSFAYTAINWLYSGLLRLLSERYAAQDGDGFSRAYTTGKLCFIGFGVIGGIGLLVFELGFSTLFGDAGHDVEREILTALLLSVVHFLLLCELAAEMTLFAVVKRQALANITVMLGLIVSVIATVVCLVSGGGLASVLGSFVLGDIVARLFAWIARHHQSIHTDWRWPSGWRDPAVKGLLSGQAKHYFAYSLIGMGLGADTLLIGLLGGSTVTADFVLVWKIAEVLILVLGRFPQHLQAELVDMDAKGDHARIKRVYRHANRGMCLAAAVLGILYAAFGQWIVGLWIGSDRVPANQWAYVLAGGAVFWLGMSRLQSVFACSLVRLQPLVRLSAIELTMKLLLIFILYPYLGFLAPLAAINLVYLCGVAYAYMTLNRSWAMG
jgi:O-antigen/teichoic acid export membrane protein